MMNSTQIIKELKLDPKNVLNIYLMGSRLWGTNRPDSDYDIIVVCKKNEGQMSLHTPKINATVLDLNTFIDRVKNHEYLETVAIHSPSEFRLSEDVVVKPKFNYDLFKKSIEYRIGRDLAHIAKNDQKGKCERANKTRHMCLNMLAIAIEIVKHHQSDIAINFQVGTKYKKATWTKFEFDTIFQQLKDQFDSVLVQPSANDQ